MQRDERVALCCCVTVIPPSPESARRIVAPVSRYRSKVLPQQWGSSATAERELCYGSGTALLPQRVSCATAAAMRLTRMLAIFQHEPLCQKKCWWYDCG